jgi:VIT1/CCC1 family predicted Fe2+/Mn2+ transporter
MRMKTYSLADNNWQSNLHSDLNPYEIYKTRLIRVDLPRRTGPRDLLQHSIRKYLRAFWFYVRRGGLEQNQPATIQGPSTAEQGQPAAEGDPSAVERGQSAGGQGATAAELEESLTRSYQNTAFLAETITRLLVALLGGFFLVVPLVILSSQSSNSSNLVTVSICIVIFAFLISFLTKASNQEIMAASAAYAAVLSVFVSNTQASLHS